MSSVVDILREQVIRNIIDRNKSIVIDEASSKSGGVGTSGGDMGGKSAFYSDAIAGLEGDSGIVVNNAMMQPFETGPSPEDIKKLLWYLLRGRIQRRRQG